MSLRYKNPPVTEAILDLRVEPRSGASAIEIVMGLEQSSNFVKKFPVRQELPLTKDLSADFEDGQFDSIVSGMILGGFRYESADGKQNLEVRRDGFVFSLLPPYHSWEEFSGIARPLWEVYCQTWRPLLITRVALRYVNQLNFPRSEFAQDNFSGLLPKAPRAQILPTGPLESCFLQMNLPQSDIGVNAVVSYYLAAAEDGQNVAGALDIDLFRSDINIAWTASVDSQLWNWLAQMRERKNDLFRSYITESMERSFEPQE